MACASGCCAPSLGTPSELEPRSAQLPDQENPSRASDALDSSAHRFDPAIATSDEESESCLTGSSRKEIPCQDTCCAGPTRIQAPQSGTGREAPDTERNDACCAPVPANLDCAKSCCSSPETPSSDDTPAPPCCEGKAAPCCDRACLDRLALRECETVEPAAAVSHGSSVPSLQATSSCGQGRDGKPCDKHSRKIREMYLEKLEAIGCICRSLIALGQETCCVPSRHWSARRPRLLSKDMLSRSGSRDSAASCCDGANGCSAARVADSKKSSGATARSVADSCADSCCAEQRPSIAAEELPTPVDHAVFTADPEKGLSGGEKEHVILSISGMTCTGCETKLARSLGALPSIRNLKTSLVLSRAEFDLVGGVPVAEILKHLKRTTEFTCERIANQGSSLELIACNGDAAALASQSWPDGVIEVTVARKSRVDVINVTFDAAVIGARSLVERDWGDSPVRLAAPRLDPALDAGGKHVRRVGYMTLLSACLTIPVLVMAWAPLPRHDLEYGSTSLVLATLVQFIVAGPFYPEAVKALIFSRVIEMDLLVVLSTSAAYVFSVVSFGYSVSGKPLQTGQFFETSTLLVTLIMLGRWLAALARHRAVVSISLRSLQSPTALVVTDEGEREIDARLLQYGDVFKVVPDCKIPTDGTVISGSSEVDESMMTGESLPVEKHAECSVIAGSINGSGTLYVALTRLPGDNTISTIAAMVDGAKLSKPRIQGIADRAASYFVPVIVVLASITFCIWVAIGVTVQGLSGSEAAIQAITYAITVLIVSCPCAIGLAVPMVVVIASGVAAERGVVFKSAEGLETARKASHVVLDKTGTITEGKLAVVREWYADSDPSLAKSLLLGLVESIKHPVSVAVAAHLRAQDVSSALVSDPKSLAGKGVEGIAKDSGLMLRAGNCRWLSLESDTVAQSILSRGSTAFCFTIGGSVAAIFGLQDSIRPDAAVTIRTLLDCGISVHVISGDDDGAVRAVAAELGIPEAQVRSRCTPADKQKYIRDLLDIASPNPMGKTKSSEKPVVIFCGDGTNDAVALAQATIGVHMNEGGTDIAESAADIVLMRSSLSGILTIITASRKSMRRIAFNFGWSFVYNLFAILLAAGAFVHARIPPEFAGLGELVSVLPVVVAAMQLRWADM